MLVRDRFGVKPLVYAKTATRLYAASEAKQIFAAADIRPTLNYAAALSFLLDGELNLEAQTFFEGVTELRGGHYAIYDIARDRFEVQRWYDVSAQVRRSNADYSMAREQVGEILRDAVRLRLMTDVPLGACLSGGIDSSSICAISSTLIERSKDFKVFTVFHPGAGYDERQYSREMVDRFGFHSIEVQPDLNDLFTGRRFEEMAKCQDQPIPSGSHYNEYVVFKTAREADVTVVLDGQGADEYFGGYGEFWDTAQFDHLRKLDISAFMQGIESRAESVGTSKGQILKGFVRAVSAPRRQRSGWRRKVGRPSAGRHAGAFSRQDFVDLSLEQMVTSSLPYQLHSLDRHSMRWSVEARMPMTDYRLVELVLSLPTEYKVGGGFQKRILRDAVPGLPANVANRRSKMAFGSPDREFMARRPDVIRPMLAEAAAYAARLVPAEAILSHFDAMVEGRAAYDSSYFRLLSFHAWGKAFGVNP